MEIPTKMAILALISFINETNLARTNLSDSIVKNVCVGPFLDDQGKNVAKNCPNLDKCLYYPNYFFKITFVRMELVC